MILSRIVEHLRKQHWTAVFIELVIVVLGVFIGMQVSNWNQAQADKRLGRAYSQRLTIDLRKDLAARRSLVEYYGAVLESIERTNKLLADPRSDARELVVDAYRGSEVNYSPQTHATWDEIVSSGDTGLLPRAAIESGIADYFALDSARISYDSLIVSAYRHRVRSIIPLEVQKAMRAGCSDVRGDTQQIVGFMPNCKLDVDEQTIVSTAAALRADPGVVADLRYQYSDVYSARANISGDVVLLTRALAAVGDGNAPASPATP